MTRHNAMAIVLVVFGGLLTATAAAAQPATQRGFVDGRGVFFPQTAPNDDVQAVGDLLVREEVFLNPSAWFKAEGGIDFRANSHDQVEDEWRLDFQDRSIQRPKLAVRRLAAIITAGKFSVQAGKQFIRWGRADVLNPTDRFAPRDYLNVFEAEFLPVIAVRPIVQAGTETFEAVWSPRLTPSRLPLIDQRWTIIPPEAVGVRLVDAGAIIGERSEQGVRWNHTGQQLEMSLSFFDGYNHLPNIDVREVPVPLGAPPTAEIRRLYPRLQTYGGDVAIPTSLFTLKGEAAYFRSPEGANEDYVLYVAELERQVGEWVLVIGYAGDVVTKDRDVRQFAPDRGIAKSILGHASYTVDPNRTVTIEGAARQSGDGFYLKGEYSQAAGRHLRVTFAGVLLAGKSDDFLGQYQKNSNLSAGLRVSF